MSKTGNSLTKAKLIQAALEEHGLDNPIDVVTIIGALGAIISAIEAYSVVKKLWERGKH